MFWLNFCILNLIRSETAIRPRLCQSLRTTEGSIHEKISAKLADEIDACIYREAQKSNFCKTSARLRFVGTLEVQS